jgi:hypothetical protein
VCDLVQSEIFFLQVNLLQQDGWVFIFHYVWQCKNASFFLEHIKLQQFLQLRLTLLLEQSFSRTYSPVWHRISERIVFYHYMFN